MVTLFKLTSIQHDKFLNQKRFCLALSKSAWSGLLNYHSFRYMCDMFNLWMMIHCLLLLKDLLKHYWCMWMI